MGILRAVVIILVVLWLGGLLLHGLFHLAFWLFHLLFVVIRDVIVVGIVILIYDYFRGRRRI
jgi:hypothetical protein